MAKIVPLNATDCTIVFSCAGIQDPLACSIGMVATPEETAAQVASSLAAALAIGGLIAPANLMTAYTVVGIEARKMTATGFSVAFHTLGNVGTTAQPPPPVNCTQLITKVTGSGGRQGRGRMFWPPCDLDEASVDPAGQIALATHANRQGRWDAFFDALDPAELLPVVFHNTKPDGSMPVVTEPTVITAFVLDGQIATQRRRMR